MPAHPEGLTPDEAGTLLNLDQWAETAQQLATATQWLREAADQLAEPKPVTVRGSEKYVAWARELVAGEAVRIDGRNPARLRLHLSGSAAGLLVTNSQPALDGFPIPTTPYVLATRSEVWVRNATPATALYVYVLIEYED